MSSHRIEIIYQYHPTTDRFTIQIEEKESRRKLFNFSLTKANFEIFIRNGINLYEEVQSDPFPYNFISYEYRSSSQEEKVLHSN